MSGGVESLNSKGSFESTQDGPNLVAVDQKLVVFDIEQSPNASQLISLQSLSKKPISWRIQTNAPTRYIVCPNGGVLSSHEPQKILIELVGNGFNPQHRLVLRATTVDGQKQAEEVWENEGDLLESGSVQTIHFELGTTLMYLDQAMNINSTTTSQEMLTNHLNSSQTAGAERLKELDEMLAMIQNDNETLTLNTTHTENLTKTLKKQIADKNQLGADTAKSLNSFERELLKKQLEIFSVETELQQLREQQRPAPTSLCLLM